MEGQTGNKKIKYAHLNRLTTETLEELLRADIESLDNDDDKAVLHILEVIEQREKAQPTGRLSDVNTAWEDFQKYYNTPEGDGLSLYSDETPEELHPMSQPIQKPMTVRFKRRGMWRALTAAVIAVFLIVFAVPPALGYQNFIQMVGQWTANVFNFNPDSAYSTSTSSTENENTIEQTAKYENLQMALDDYGITESVAPTKIADGFQLTRVTVEESTEFHTINFNAYYENDKGKSISISVTQRSLSGSYNYEKDDTSVTPYVAGQVTHYIFENNNRMVATWYLGTLECAMKADIPLAEMEKMIDSIYER